MTKQKPKLKTSTKVILIIIIALFTLGIIISGFFCWKKFVSPKFEKKQAVVVNQEVKKEVKEANNCDSRKIFDLEEENRVLKSENEQLQTAIKILTLSDSEKAVRETFTDNDIKLSFQYPKYWGPVILSEKYEPSDKNRTIVFQGLKSQNVVVVGNPDIETLGHGGSFWDFADSINNEEQIKKVCFLNEGCQLINNKNGILIAKNSYIIATEGGPESDFPTNQYVFYNPNSRYHGVAISPARILVGQYIENFDKVFEDVVMSMKILP